MKLLGGTKSKTTKNENAENVRHLEITEVVLVYSNIVTKSFQHNSRVLRTFVSNKSFGQLLDILAKYVMFLKTFNSEFSCIESVETWFTDQKYRPLDREDKINITLDVT